MTNREAQILVNKTVAHLWASGSHGSSQMLQDLFDFAMTGIPTPRMPDVYQAIFDFGYLSSQLFKYMGYDYEDFHIWLEAKLRDRLTN